jgi:hypothetical protein
MWGSLVAMTALTIALTFVLPVVLRPAQQA